MKLNKNNFLVFTGTFTGSIFWTLAFSEEKNEVCLIPPVDDFYTAQIEFLTYGTALFSNQALSAPAANGWYSDGLFKYNVVAGLITTVLNCEG